MDIKYHGNHLDHTKINISQADNKINIIHSCIIQLRSMETDMICDVKGAVLLSTFNQDKINPKTLFKKNLTLFKRTKNNF